MWYIENSVSTFSNTFHTLEVLNVYIDLGQKTVRIKVPTDRNSGFDATWYFRKYFKIFSMI